LSKATQTAPPQTNSSPLAKTLPVFDEMEYNIVEDMKNTRANITFHELSKLKHQHKLLLKDLKATPTYLLPAAVISQAAQEMGRPPNTSLDRNLHNYSVYFGASSNFLPRTVCMKLNVEPQKSDVHSV